jgi:hypothetical protein
VGGVRHRYRLIVGCSASSQLVELDVIHGAAAAPRVLPPARAWVTTRIPEKPPGAWLTSIKLHRGSLYACQYQKKGVLQFDGDSLRYQRIVASNNRIGAPEGLAFTQGHMFVTSADSGRVLMYNVHGREVDAAVFADEVGATVVQDARGQLPVPSKANAARVATLTTTTNNSTPRLLFRQSTHNSRAVQCSAVQCSAGQCSAVQCSAVQCSQIFHHGTVCTKCKQVAALQ